MQERTYNAFYGYLGVRILTWVTWVVSPMFVLVKCIDLVDLSQPITNYESTCPASNIWIQDVIFFSGGYFYWIPAPWVPRVPIKTRLESSIQMFKPNLKHASLVPRQDVPAWHNHAASHL